MSRIRQAEFSGGWDDDDHLYRRYERYIVRKTLRQSDARRIASHYHGDGSGGHVLRASRDEVAGHLMCPRREETACHMVCQSHDWSVRQILR